MSQFKFISLLIIGLFITGCSNLAVSPSKITAKIDDNTYETISFFLTKTLQMSVLTQNANVDDKTLYVGNTTNCLVFDAIDVYDNNNYFQSLILSKTDTTITMNSEIDRDFNSIDTVIKCGKWNLGESDGSVVEETFMIKPPMNRTWHLTSTSLKITDNADWDLSTFGSRSALTNGISGRIQDGYRKDLFLIYDNSGFSLRGFDLKNFEKAPSGVYGFTGKLIFKDIFGTVIQLDGDTFDEWQAVNRDDLTSQEEIGILVSGHYYDK